MSYRPLARALSTIDRLVDATSAGKSSRYSALLASHVSAPSSDESLCKKLSVQSSERRQRPGDPVTSGTLTNDARHLLAPRSRRRDRARRRRRYGRSRLRRDARGRRRVGCAPPLRDTPPFEVKLQRKRVNFLGRKIVADEPDERKEDSDDESEEDEARHPLIVHDRDPEQNLEALRDPSRFRQNLA